MFPSVPLENKKLNRRCLLDLGWLGRQQHGLHRPCEVDRGQSTRAASRQRTWWHQGVLGGIHDQCKGQSWSLWALLLPRAHPPPGPAQGTVIHIQVLSSRLGHSTFHRKRWQCALCIAPGDSLHPWLSRQSNTRGAKGCLGLGHIYVREERGFGQQGCCAVCQVAQDAFEFTARQIGFDVQERFQVPFADIWVHRGKCCNFNFNST